MNVGNIGNIRTDIKSQTFTEPQFRADVNDDGNFKNGGMSGTPGMSGILIHAHNINFVVLNRRCVNLFAYVGTRTQTPAEQLEFRGRVSGPKF